MPSSKGKTPPREVSEKGKQITVLIPLHWFDLLDALAERDSILGAKSTRTDMARRAMAIGIDSLQKRPTSNK